MLNITTNNNCHTLVRGSALSYDLAIMVLKEKVVLSKNIQLAYLPEENAPCPKGRSLILSGWGDDKSRPYRSLRYLWAVKQECLNITECPYYIGKEDVMLCVGDSENSLNSGCNGDSGGKVVFYFTYRYFDVEI